MDFDRQRGDPRQPLRLPAAFLSARGLRYVQSEQPLAMPEAMYETDSAVSQYCEAHYGKTYFNVPNFSAQCAAACFQYTRERPRRKALDLGCAVGRASFELARQFDHVTGIDFSARFIRVALQLKEKGHVYFELVEEGEVVSYHEARLSDVGAGPRGRPSGVLPGRRDEPQAAIHRLRSGAGRQSDRPALRPQAVPGNDSPTAEPGGVLVITSPYTWLEEFTKKENWLGGFRKGGEPCMTLEALGELLGPHFAMLEAAAGHGIRDSRNTAEIPAHGRRIDRVGAYPIGVEKTMPDPRNVLTGALQRVGVAADHGGFELKECLVGMLLPPAMK